MPHPWLVKHQPPPCHPRLHRTAWGCHASLLPLATLSPSWQPPDALPGIVKNFPAWFVAAACGLFIILLFILLSTLLGSSAERVVETFK